MFENSELDEMILPKKFHPSKENAPQSDSCPKEMGAELLKDLHLQFAENNNASLSIIIGLFASLITVVGIYGFVYIHSSYLFTYDFQKLYCGDYYSLEVVLLCACISIIILMILSQLCISVGVANRLEQFIIFAIRVHALFEPRIEADFRIFPEGYHPFGKKGIEIVIGMFGEFVKIFRWFIYFIFLTALIKILLNIFVLNSDTYSFPGIITSTFLLILTGWSLKNLSQKFSESVDQYNRYQDQYKELAEKVFESTPNYWYESKAKHCNPFQRKLWNFIIHPYQVIKIDKLEE